MIKNILVPLEVANDSSIENAIAIARQFDAHLDFFHAYARTQAAYPTGSTMDGHAPVLLSPEDGKKIKEDILSELRQKYPQLKAVSHDLDATPGIAVDLIAGEAKTSNSDLIILGSQEANIIEKILGTKSERVSRKVNCPLLVIPEDHNVTAIDKIGLAVNKESLEHEVHLKLLLELVKKNKAKLEVVNVREEDDNEISAEEHIVYKQLSDALGTELSYYSFNVIKGEDEEKGILDFIAKYDIDFLALIYREHGFFKRIFSPGLRKKLIQNSDIPLLILK